MLVSQRSLRTAARHRSKLARSVVAEQLHFCIAARIRGAFAVTQFCSPRSFASSV
jgi:hypothetical protein